MSGSAPSDPSSNPVRCLIVLAALAVLMYLCTRTFRFTHDGLNIAFGCVFLLLPFSAIKPALRLPRWGKITTLALLAPVLTFSLLGLSAMVACDIPDAVRHVQLSRELSTLQHGEYSVHLAWKETAGGAVGPHGVSLEQRRSIFPGIYLVKSLDYSRVPVRVPSHGQVQTESRYLFRLLVMIRIKKTSSVSIRSSLGSTSDKCLAAFCVDPGALPAIRNSRPRSCPLPHCRPTALQPSFSWPPSMQSTRCL